MIAIKISPSLIRKLALAAVCLTMLLAAGFVSIPVSSGPVLAELREILSRDLSPVSTIEGRASLHFLPQPTIEISSLSLSFDNKIELQSPSVSFGLRMFSLLGSRYEPTSMHLEQPKVSVPERLVPTDLVSLAPLLAASLAADDDRDRALSRHQIEMITMNGGKIEISGTANTLAGGSNLKASLYFLKEGSKSLSLSGLWHQQDVAAKVDLGKPDPRQEQASRLSFDFNAPTGSVRLEGEVFRRGKAEFDGTIVSDVSRIDRLSEWLNLSPPVDIATSLRLDGKAHLTPLALAVSDAQVKLGPVQMTGGISFDVSGPRTLVTGTLSAGDMDVTSFLTPVWPKQISSAGWKLDTFDQEATPRQDLDIRLSAERVNLGIVRISNVALAIMAKDRALDVTLASAKLFQGSAKGKMSMRPVETGYSVSTHGSFEAIDIGQSTLALMDMKKVEGTATGKFNFDASGTTLDQIMKSLSGTTEFAITNGTLTGINMASVLKRIETRPLSVIRDMRGGKTDFETMHVFAQANDGKAELSDTDMKFAPNHMVLKGQINIGARTLNLTGEALGPPPSNGAEPAVLAYTVTGNFDDPIVTPDINRILKRSNEAPASAE